jgi:hypothetical protein
LPDEQGFFGVRDARVVIHFRVRMRCEPVIQHTKQEMMPLNLFNMLLAVVSLFAGVGVHGKLTTSSLVMHGEKTMRDKIIKR